MNPTFPTPRVEDSARAATQAAPGRAVESGSPDGTLSRDEWIDRAALRYRERAGMPARVAGEAATALFEFYADTSSPEEAVDEDVSYWSDDE